MEITVDNLEPATGPRSHGVPPNEALAKQRMEDYIAQCRARAAGTLEKIFTVVPTDRVIPAPAFTFQTGNGRLEYLAPTGKNAGLKAETLHRNALTQLAGRLNIPMAYIDHLTGAQTIERGGPVEAANGTDAIVDRWGMQLLQETLQRHVDHSTDRFLVRSVGDETRAVLSDKFRRLDCRPGAESLILTAKAAGLVCCDGTFTDTRSSLKFIRPTAIEVFPGEWMVFGFEWSNSDYGRGASDLRMFMFRLWCWNGATIESVIRQIHVGRRLGDEIEYAQDTLEADAKASALVLRDAAATAMSKEKTMRMIEGIRAAQGTKIDPKGRAESLKKILTKTEAEAVVQAFNSPDVENMPAGNTLWRWSNAISWVGGNTEDADRRLDFERLAGEVMKPAMPKAPEPEKVAA